MAVKKSKVGFGQKEDIETAKSSGLIDEYDILCLDNHEFGWLDANKNTIINTPRTQSDIQINGVEGLGIADGGTLDAGLTLEEAIQKLVQRKIEPDYITPEVTLTNNSGDSGVVESGSSIVPKLKATFTQNDAGTLTTLEILKNDESVGSGNASPYDYTGDAIIIEDEDVIFKAKATYAEGAIKKDNLGSESPDNHIPAGSIVSKEYTISGKRNMFYGYGVGIIEEITSDIVRGLSNKRLDPHKDDIITFTVSKGSQYILICLPADKELASITYDNINDPMMLPLFKKSTVQVADARGDDNGLMDYNCYLYNLAVSAPASMTFTIKIQ